MATFNYILFGGYESKQWFLFLMDFESDVRHLPGLQVGGLLVGKKVNKIP